MIERDVEHGAGRLVEIEAGEFGIAHDADNAVAAVVFGKIDPEVLADRVFLVAEETFDKGLIDDGDVSGILRILRGEVPATHERNLEVLEVIGGDAVPGRASILA